jgi:very-short-patch-repair endonuclease
MNRRLKGKGVAPTFLEQARLLRSTQTKAEIIFWAAVRNRQLAESKFRRQHQIGPYIVDFCCTEARLVVELDGGYHDTPEQIALDVIRDAALQDFGFRVLRFTNTEVEEDLDFVLTKLNEVLSAS